MFVWAALAAVGTFVIAAVAVGSVTGRLARSPRRSVYDLEEAVQFVAERLPAELTAELSYDDVRAVLGFHCDYLADKGVASARTADEIGSGLVLVSDDEPLAYVLGRCEAASLEVPDAAVATILEVERGYYQAIGAIGPQVTGPDDPGRPGPEGPGGPGPDRPATAPTMTTSAEPDHGEPAETEQEGTE
ncbi:MAG: hypothetical protein ACKO04_12240 [Actinomycetes bacterium]